MRWRRPDRRWVIVGTLAVTETIAWGILYYAFAVFQVPMQRELGWSPAVITGAFSVALLVSGLAAPAVGRAVDRHGGRWLMAGGGLLGAALLAAWAAVGSIPSYYLIWAGLGLAMAATLYEPAFAVVTPWFTTARARALLVITLAAGFASTIFLPLTTLLVERLGWRPALLALALILALGTVPAHLLVLRRPPAGRAPAAGPITAGTPAGAPPGPAPGVTAAAARRDPGFWLLGTALVLGRLATVTSGLVLIPYLIGRGYSPGLAAAITGLTGAFQVGARIAVTVVGERRPPTWLLAVLLGLEAAALGLLIVSVAPAAVLVAVALIGTSRGAATLLRATIIVERYGPAHFGAINGLVALPVSMAAAIAPLGAGLVLTGTGSYLPIFAGLAVACLGAALAAARLHARPAPHTG